MSKHTDFILTPITSILEEMVVATRLIGDGIETYPLYEYIIQSTFIKMTGFQEQKLRCISWEMATNDYEFRRKLLNNELKLGEYSTYKSKNSIYKELLNKVRCIYPDIILIQDNKNLKKLMHDLEKLMHDLENQSNMKDCLQKNIDKIQKNIDKIQKNIDKIKENIDKIKKNINELKKVLNENILFKIEIYNKTVSTIKVLFKGSNIETWMKKHFKLFEKNYNILNYDNFFCSKYTQFLMDESNILESELKEKYEALYSQRNRIAHNVKSFQHNLPSFNTLLKEDEESRNYFVWFFILVLIDNIFIELYKKYLELDENENF